VAVEIERKFLVRGDFRPDVVTSTRICQGYLCSAPERTVRVRLCGTRAFLTIKGSSGVSGLTRYEWECELPATEAMELLELCEPGRIDKIRHRVDFAGKTFEVDEFGGDNQGLLIAELELECEEESFDCPDWLGQEVTGEPRYYNSSLVRNPYRCW